MLRTQNKANRPNVYTPGSYQEWTELPGDRWELRSGLSPEGERSFRNTETGRAWMSDLGLTSLDQYGDTFRTPYSVPGSAPRYQGPEGPLPSYGGVEGELGPYGEHRQEVMDAMMSRVNTDISREKDRKSAELVARGIPIGSPAYQREMEYLDRKQVDATQQAEIAAEEMAGMGYSSDIAGRKQMQGEAESDYDANMRRRLLSDQEALTQFTTDDMSHRQEIADSLLPRSQGMQEMKYFTEGGAGSLPEIQPYGQMGFAGGPDYTQSAMNAGNYQMGKYNAKMGQQNALLGGIFGLGSAWLGS